MTKKGKDQYEDFYERAFLTVDIDKIYEEGGAISIQNFFNASKNNIKDKEYYKALKYKVSKAKKYKDWTLGGMLWDRYFKDERLTQNKINRIIVKKGESFIFKGTTYKGGMFVPKDYIIKRY